MYLSNKRAQLVTDANFSLVDMFSLLGFCHVELSWPTWPSLAHTKPHEYIKKSLPKSSYLYVYVCTYYAECISIICCGCFTLHFFSSAGCIHQKRYREKLLYTTPAPCVLDILRMLYWGNRYPDDRQTECIRTTTVRGSTAMILIQSGRIKDQLPHSTLIPIAISSHAMHTSRIFIHIISSLPTAGLLR